jgi:streptogrisin D
MGETSNMSFRSRTTVSAAVAATILTVVAMADPAAAAPTPPAPQVPAGTSPGRRTPLDDAPGMTPAVKATMAAQDRAGHIVSAVQAVSAPAGSGLGGAVLDGSRLRVYWHGPVPAALTQVIDSANNNGVPTSVVSAPYTQAELRAEADRLSRQPLFTGTVPGHRALRVAPKPDGTGIAAAMAGLPASMSDAAALRTVPALHSKVPVSFSRMGMPAFSSRFVDSVPYYGGAFIQNGNTGCTSGFGVTGNNGAATYIMTAAHCGAGTWTTGRVNFSDGSYIQNTLGSTIAAGRDTGRDVELILTSAGGGLYWGSSINPPNGDVGSNTYVNVSGDATNLPGAVICQSGAYSGTQCNAQMISVGNTITITPAENGVSRITNLVMAESTDDAAFTGQGDSGGPVTSVAANGSVVGRGINSAVDSSTSNRRTCKGYNYSGRICSWISYFADLQGAEAAVGVHINTQ